MAPTEPKKISPIVKAISQIERSTTGKIRVHLSYNRFEKDPRSAAKRVFRKYGLYKTPQRSGVLIYLNLKRKHFAILGDRGIHEKIGEAGWERLIGHLREDLLSTHFENALAIAVHEIGAVLRKHFPAQTSDT